MEAMSATLDGAEQVEIPKEIRLELTVVEPEVILELNRHPKGAERDRFALSALRLGVQALRQASGVIDGTMIQREGENLLNSVRDLLRTSFTENLSSLSATLKQYFDPANGNLSQRLERLVKKDGELETLLARHLDGESSTITRTLAKHIGEQSPLLRLLSPTQSDGLLAALEQVIQDALQSQTAHVLRQFSLDDKESALSRLVSELTGANGKLKEDLSEDLEKVRAEFSLDNDQGALSRLVSRVEKAQQTIVDQFSGHDEDSVFSRMSRMLEATNSKVEASLTLDDENSPLYRLRRELLQVLEGFANSNTQFQTEVRSTLESFKARREETARSTIHGNEFEDLVGSVLQAEAQRLGDIFEATGHATGNLTYCKVGDHVITLGPENTAAGARIVSEAKDSKSYDVTKALSEIGRARENRNAQVGIFVFSKSTAPEGVERLSRFGTDILVVWDREDPATDIFLKAALSIARALVVRNQAEREKAQTDLAELENSVARVAKDAENLEEILTWAGTIKNSSQKILDKAERIRDDLDKQVGFLREYLDALNEGTEGDPD